MIIGGFFRCINCSHEYRIRFNMGNVFPQKSTFKCKSCGEYLEFGYDDKRLIIKNGLEEIESSDSSTIQNLHPELPLDLNKENDPYYFPSVDFMSKYWSKVKDDKGSFRAGQKSMAKFKSQLDDAVLELRYLKEKRWSILEKKYGKNHSKIQRTIFKKLLEVGRLFLQGRWDSIYKDSLSEFESSKKLPNYKLMKQFMELRKDDFLIEKMYDLLNTYNKAYHELLPTLLTQKFGMAPQGYSSSANWDKLEMVYGSFYETYGDLLIVPTAINNLLIRGDHQLFSTVGFSLADYLKTDKAGRGKNFVSNTKLQALQEFYDAGLRNGTYHKGSKVSEDEQVVNLKMGKGGSTQRTLSLIEYIEFCNELFARSLILLNLTYKMTH